MTNVFFMACPFRCMLGTTQIHSELNAAILEAKPPIRFVHLRPGCAARGN